MNEKEKAQEQNPTPADIDNLEVTELEDEDLEDVSGGVTDTNNCNVVNT